MTRQVAVVFEDDKPIRAFDGEACIYKAYKWAYHHFCLSDYDILPHQLPNWLNVKYYLMTEEQFKELVK